MPGKSYKRPFVLKAVPSWDGTATEAGTDNKGARGLFVNKSLLFLKVFGMASFASGQQVVNASTLSGRVCDPSGSFIPDASVTASKTGFSETRASVDLTTGAAFDLRITLTVAGAKTDVQVVSESPLVETVRTQTSETIRPDEIANVPLNGRNYLDLALLAPGVSRINASRSTPYLTTSAVPGTTVSISGQRNLGTSFIVDGLSSNDDSTELSGAFYSLDVIREFQVVTAGGTAEFGRASSGFANVVTRSSTNQFHGSGYGFVRNQRYDARDALSATKLPLTRAQYGASFGGPFVHHRTLSRKIWMFCSCRAV